MSARVLHGRRTGQDRATPEMEVAPGPQSAGTLQPNVRDVTILTRTDWGRISDQLNKRANEQERLRVQREEKQRLHELSKEKVKTWTNTISGQRQKKLEGRRIREDKEEEERKLVDVEEAKFQAQKRKEAIERAKTQQYYQTDRVKGFHGALLLTEVLKEREAQLELKRLKERAGSGYDKEYLEQSKRDHEAAILRDQELARERIEKTRENASFQKAQIRNRRRLERDEKDEDEIEGEELKRLAVQYELEKKRLFEIQQQEARQLMTDNVQQISDVYKIRDIHKDQEEEEDEECRIFAAAKRKMMKLRAEKEQQLHEDKQTRLEKIREKLHAQMQQKMDDEDERLMRAEHESDEKKRKEEEETSKKHAQVLKDMAEHRHMQMKNKEEQATAERRREMEILLVKQQADNQFAENEERKKHTKFHENKDLQNFHAGQIDEKFSKVTVERENDLIQDQKNRELLELEEQQFQEYAQRVIRHCDKNGRNVYPLYKAARGGAGGGSGPVFPGKGGVRPSYMVADKSGVQMPNYQRESTSEIKSISTGSGQTNKRLGFVW